MRTRSRIALLLSALSAVLAAGTFGQQPEKSPEPPNPPVAPLPPYSAWRVEQILDENRLPDGYNRSSSGELQFPPEAVRSVVIRSDGNLQRSEATFGDGTKLVVYSGGNHAAYFDRGNGEPVLVKTLARSTSLDLLFSVGFPMTGWVSPADFAGIEAINGVQCFHYLRKGIDPAELSGEADRFVTSDLEAWIAVETAWPLRVAVNDSVFQFAGPQPAPGKVELPSNLLPVVQQYENEQKGLRFRRR